MMQEIITIRQSYTSTDQPRRAEQDCANSLDNTHELFCSSNTIDVSNIDTETNSPVKNTLTSKQGIFGINNQPSHLLSTSSSCSVSLPFSDQNNSLGPSKKGFSMIIPNKIKTDIHYQRLTKNNSTTELPQMTTDPISFLISSIRLRIHNYCVKSIKRPIRKNRRFTFVSLLFVLFAFFFISLTAFSSLTTNDTENDCTMCYMCPSYIKMKDFTKSKSRLSSKYSLYLYRELGIDTMPQPQGIPVIFIPGNAGSYKQVRALAAGATQMFQDEYQPNPLIQNFDFFTADFNEDLTAFHGQSLLDQAEYLNDAIRYILSLYRKSTKTGTSAQHHYPHPESVIIIGHSMGGMVARTMVTLPNYDPNSISTIVTLATPHTVPPISFDADLVSIYDKVNRYWKNSFATIIHNKNPLASLCIISVAGGNFDYMVPSEYSIISPIVPASNGLTVFTSMIPKVWRSIDHQSIVWCDELRRVLIRTLFESVDARAMIKVKPISQRMKIFSKNFLTGIEDVFYINSRKSIKNSEKTLKDYEDDLELKSGSSISSFLDKEVLNPDQSLPDTILIIDDLHKTVIPPSNALRLSRLGTKKMDGHSYLMPISENGDKVLSILSDQKFLDPPSNSVMDPQSIDLTHLTASTLDNMADDNATTGLYIFACTLPENYVTPETYLSVMDISGGSSKSQIRASLICKSLAQESVQVPSSKSTLFNGAQDLDSIQSKGSISTPFSYLQYEMKRLKPYKFIVITDTNPRDSEGFVKADISDKSAISLNIKTTIWDLFWRGLKIHLPNQRAVMMDISLNVPLSSLLSFKLKLNKATCTKQNVNKMTGPSTNIAYEPLFSPMVRQYSTNGHESKFHVNMDNDKNQRHIFFHNVAPYTPFQGDESTDSLRLQIWSDTFCKANTGNDQELIFGLDWLSTMGRWLMHYRMAVGIFPFSILAFILMIQFVYYNSTGIFISFSDAILIFIRELLIWILSIASILSWAVNTTLAKNLFYFIGPSLYSSSGEESSLHFSKFGSVGRRELFLGVDEPALWFMGPLFIIVAVGLVIFFGYAIKMIIDITAWSLVIISRLIACFQDAYGLSYFDGLGMNQSGEERFSKFSKFTTTRRLVTAAILLILVTTFIPYQFAFIVACTIQIMAVTKERFWLFKPACGKTETSTSTLTCGKSNNKIHNFYNYSFSVLMIMLCIVPINAPVLIVWIHDLSVRWQTPFSSHHNLLSVLPIMFLVEKTTRRCMIPQMWNVSQVQFTVCMLLYMSFYALIFGMMHAYWLHHLVNFFSTWLLFIYWGADKQLLKQLDNGECASLDEKTIETEL